MYTDCLIFYQTSALYLKKMHSMTAFNAIAWGRVLLGISLIGIGLLHFFVPGIQPILAPLSPDQVWPAVRYLAGIGLVLAGLALVLNKGTTIVAISLVAVFLLFFLFGHLPNRIQSHPGILAFWTDAIKLLAMTGGALLLTGTGNNVPGRRMPTRYVVGKCLFALMLLLFGIDHFLYVNSIHTLIPSWIPHPVAWTYIAGVALMGAAISTVTGIRVVLVQWLLAGMLFIWLWLIHVPMSLTHALDGGGHWLGALTCMYFMGTALLVAGRSVRKRASAQKIYEAATSA